MADQDRPGSDTSAVAAMWERHRELLFERQRAVSEWLVDRVDPQPGHTVVDLACGPGETGFLAAERVGLGGRLISTDSDEGMVMAARRGIDARGLTNADARQMDAMSIDLPQGSVDAVISRFGLMLMQDPAAVVSGVSRLLRPGGRFAYAVWSTPDANPWTATLREGAARAGFERPGIDLCGRGGIYSLAEPSANEALLHSAGFGQIEMAEVPGAHEYASFDEYWGLHMEMPDRFVAELDDASRARLADSVREVMAPFQSDHGYSIPTLAICVAATSPS